MCHEHLLFSHIPPFYYVTIHVLITWSISPHHPFTFLIILMFHLIYAYHIPILSRYYLGSYLLLSYASIFHLICTASYPFDYLCTSYIMTYCSISHSLPIGRSTPLISWHCSSLSFLLAMYLYSWSLREVFGLMPVSKIDTGLRPSTSFSYQLWRYTACVCHHKHGLLL